MHTPFALVLAALLSGAGIAPALASGWMHDAQLYEGGGGWADVSNGEIHIGFQCQPGLPAALTISVTTHDFANAADGQEADIHYAIGKQYPLGLRPRPTTGELKGRIEHHDGGVFAVAREMGTVAATDLAESISEADTIAAWVFVASGNSTTDLINGGLSAIPPVDDAPGMPLLGAQDTLDRVLRSCRQ